MDNGLKKVYSQQLQLMDDHYRGALEAKHNGIPIVYVTAMFPVELVRAFEPDVYVVYPENHAALMIARGQSDILVKRAEAEGLDRMGCAYELINAGYVLNGHGKKKGQDLKDRKGRTLAKLPEPDILLACDNQCRVICEWFKYISELTGNKPFKMINVGDRYDGSLDKTRLAYLVNQFEHIIEFLEEQTGTKLDRDKLVAVSKKSHQANMLWQEYLDLGARKPSPITAFDGFSHMALIVSERGRQEAIEYYENLIKATVDAAENNHFPMKEEHHRLLWDNLATWYNFRELQNMFAQNNIAVVGSTYLDAWRKALTPTNYDTLMESMARSYSTMYTNMTIPERIQIYLEMIKKFSIDGVLFHKNRSCHTFSLHVDQIAKKLEQTLGPEFRTVVFEGCQGIEGRFQKHAFETGVSVHFIER
jgi:benzoyl-CoA reductase/2-hydroxyglutaryl-CoA dehydratase subunit BcrC/BadD/HgdB